MFKSITKGAVACLTGGIFVTMSAVAASAQSTPIPQVSSTVNGVNTVGTTLVGLPTLTTSDATIDLNLYGDLNPPAETLTVFLDGVNVGTTTTGVECAAFNEAIVVPQATLAPLIADGQVNISFQSTADVGNFCPSYNGSPANVAFVASGTLTYTGATPPVASPGQIGTFLENRARSLVQNQPDVLRFVDGRLAGHFNAEVTSRNGNIDFATAARGPFWASLSGSRTDTGSGNDQSYVLGSLGGHLTFGDNAVVGAMLQIDRAEQDFASGDEVKGDGWLVGPYFAMQISEQPLFLDGRLLYGETDNEITPAGNPTDSFDGERWLAMLNLEGRVEMEHFTLFPGIAISHVRDEQKAYTDSAANLIAAQDVEQTEVALGLDFEKPLTNEDMILTWGVSGIWSDTSGSGASAAVVGASDGWRGRLDAGLDFASDNGLAFETNVFVDGLGDDNLESYGLSAGLVFSF